jgi:hypothetical protein
MRRRHIRQGGAKQQPSVNGPLRGAAQTADRSQNDHTLPWLAAGGVAGVVAGGYPRSVSPVRLPTPADVGDAAGRRTDTSGPQGRGFDSLQAHHVMSQDMEDTFLKVLTLQLVTP